MYGMVQIVLSQIPNFRKLSFLSKIAAAMSFAYSFIGICLSLARLIQGIQLHAAAVHTHI